MPRFVSSHATCHLPLPERRALERERAGTPWGTWGDRTARGNGLGPGAGLFLFCRRPTATSQQAVLSEQVLALPQAFLTAIPHSYLFHLCFKLDFHDGRAGREAG